MFKSYYLAKILHKLHIPSFNDCNIDPTARVASGSALAKVKMGRYSYAGSYTHITDAEIGSFCSIGDNCGIGGGIHPMNTVSTSPVFLQGRNIMGKNFSQIPYEASDKVRIGHDVWIGDGVFIKAGVQIGTGAVIGAHSVVTKDVPPYAIVAGAPAKILRYRFDDETIQRLLKSKWWEWSDERLSMTDFSSPEKLLTGTESEG